jgi:peroxiredoxin family protein
MDPLTTESALQTIAQAEAERSGNGEPRKKRLALVASKGGLDEAYPVLIMASTAGALEWEVGVFCTFYGLDMINKKRNKGLQVAAVGNAASPPPIDGVPIKVPAIIGMLPGMQRVATWFMKRWMKKSNIPNYDSLMEICLESGVEFYACATTMGVMNVKQEDVIDEASCLGATAFLDYAADADIALFV